jgi:integrase
LWLKPLSGKRIQNIMIPLTVIVRDAIDEYGWHDLHDPFTNLKLPKARKIRIYPFSFDEWKTLIGFISDWYKPYFEFAVQTGLRPSEQVALKWNAIDEQFIHIELCRVRNREKSDLKTEVRIPVMANSHSEGSRTVIPDDGEQLSG